MDTKGAVKLANHGVAVDFVGPDLTPAPVKRLPKQEQAWAGNTKVWSPDEAVPQHVFEKMQSELPAPVRRTSRQRHEVLIQRLLDIGKACPVIAGRVSWPDSLQKILDLTGTKNDADLVPQVFALARYMSVQTENSQKEQDARKSVLDFHGHYD